MTEFVTVREHVSITANQSPYWPSPLFTNWVNSGWEIVSVTPIAPTNTIDSAVYMCDAIGVLKMEKP